MKAQLMHSKLSGKTQARVVQACVESSLLFDCSTRVWYASEIKRIQSWIDRCYRHVWNQGRGQPLIRMQRQHENMQDVRNTLGIRSVRCKIERRVLERIGHVMRMPNSRMVKIAVLGWYEGLENIPKTAGKKRKTILYWKKVLREADVDWCDVERLVNDREGWKEIISARMGHLEEWERQRGHQYQPTDGVRLEERNTRAHEEEEDALRCKYPGCDKVCKSKGGLTIHQKRMHKVAAERARFECDRCGMSLETEGNLKNHRRACRGTRSEDPEKRRCETCGALVSKKNIARHRAACGGAGGGGGAGQQELQARVYRAREKECSICGNMLSATNMARHMRSCGGR